jgi:hypothetical protein
VRLRLAQLINERHSQSVAKVVRGIRESLGHNSVSSLLPKILNKEIKKLCVSLECMQFGEVDAKTGQVILNKSQLNAKDDDLLDDLVELALEKGIKVSVVPKKYLPDGRSFVAS